MKKYEITNYYSGEVETFESSIDIDLIERYNSWVIEQKLNPPTFSPIEFAKYLEAEKTAESVHKAVEFIERYRPQTTWSESMFESLLRILRNEE